MRQLAVKKTGFESVTSLKVVQILPALESGGVEKGTLEVAKELVKKSHQAIVISSGGKMVEALENLGAIHITFPVHKKSLFSLRHVAKFRQLLLSLDADILHVRSRLPAWLTYLAWKTMPQSSRPKLISTVHGLYSVNRYSRIMIRAEKIIVVSKTAQDYVLKNYPEVEADKLIQIYRGIEAEQFPLNYLPEISWLEKWQKQFPQLMGKKVLTLPGRLTRLKGHDSFLKLIRELLDFGENVHGLIVGGVHSGKEKYFDKLQSEVSQLGLDKHITFTGNRTDIREIYAISDLIYNLSIKPESFGRTVLEPLAMGRPVIAWNYGGVGEILGAMFPSGKVEVGNQESLLEETIEQLKSPQIPAKENPFTLQTMLDKTLSLYEKMASN